MILSVLNLISVVKDVNLLSPSRPVSIECRAFAKLRTITVLLKFNIQVVFITKLCYFQKHADAECIPDKKNTEEPPTRCNINKLKCSYVVTSLSFGNMTIISRRHLVSLLSLDVDCRTRFQFQQLT